MLGITPGKPIGSVCVTEEQSLTIHTYYACLKNISEDVARHEFVVAKQTGPGEYEALWEHPSSRVFNWIANDEMSSYEAWQSLVFQSAHTGNSFAETEYNDFFLSAFYPLISRQVQVRRNDLGKLVYDHFGDNFSTLGIPAEAIMHIRNLSRDGVMGIDWRALHSSSSLALPWTIQKFLNSYFKNNAKPSVVLKVAGDGKISDETIDAVRRKWMDGQSDENVNMPAVSHQALEIESMQFDFNALQVQQLLSSTPAQVCALLRMPPHKVGDLARSTNNNIEAQDEQYNVETLGPWRTRLESAGTRALRTAGLVLMMDEGELTRGAFSKRAESAGKLVRDGIWNKNEARAWLGKPRVADPMMDEYMADVNQVPVRWLDKLMKARVQAEAQKGAGSSQTPATSDQAQAQARAQVEIGSVLQHFGPAVRSTLYGCLRRERDRLSRARDKSDYSRRASEVVQEQGSETRAALEPIVAAMAGCCSVYGDRTGICERSSVDTTLAHISELCRRDSEAKLILQQQASWTDQQVLEEAERRSGVILNEITARWSPAGSGSGAKKAGKANQEV